MAGVSQPTVSWHLDAWNLAAADGLVPFSKDLCPGEDLDQPFPPAKTWSRYYASARHGVPTPPKSKPEPEPEEPAADDLDPEEESEPVVTVHASEPESEPEPEPEPKRRGRPRVPGSVTFDKIDRLRATRAAYPDATKTELAKLAGLSGHREVLALDRIDAAPAEVQQMIRDDELKLAVALEILDSPGLTPDQQVKFARKFVAGTFSQIGQTNKVIRPIMDFYHRARPAIQRDLLEEVALTIEQVKERWPEFGVDEEGRARTTAGAEAKGVSPELWANNFSTAIDKQLRADEVALMRLTESFPAAEAMKAFDPFLMAHTVKGMQQIRELLIKRYAELERWIVTLAGPEQVNHPERTTTDTATVTVDHENPDQPTAADVIDLGHKRATRTAGAAPSVFDGIIIDG